jgi:hypothetical protein
MADDGFDDRPPRPPAPNINNNKTKTTPTNSTTSSPKDKLASKQQLLTKWIKNTSTNKHVENFTAAIKANINTIAKHNNTPNKEENSTNSVITSSIDTSNNSIEISFDSPNKTPNNNQINNNQINNNQINNNQINNNQNTNTNWTPPAPEHSTNTSAMLNSINSITINTSMTESYNNNLLLTQPLTQLTNNDNDSPMEITPMSELSSTKSVITSEITNNNQEQQILEKYAETLICYRLSLFNNYQQMIKLS